MTSSAGPPVDWAANAALFAGREDMGQRFFRRFVELTRPIIGELHAAVSRNDRGEVRRLAHQVKGGSAAVAAVDVQRCSRELEEAAKTGSAEDLATRMLELMAAWNQVEAHARVESP